MIGSSIWRVPDWVEDFLISYNADQARHGLFHGKGRWPLFTFPRQGISRIHQANWYFAGDMVFNGADNYAGLSTGGTGFEQFLAKFSKVSPKWVIIQRRMIGITHLGLLSLPLPCGLHLLILLFCIPPRPYIYRWNTIPSHDFYEQEGGS